MAVAKKILLLMLFIVSGSTSTYGSFNFSELTEVADAYSLETCSDYQQQLENFLIACAPVVPFFLGGYQLYGNYLHEELVDDMDELFNINVREGSRFLYNFSQGALVAGIIMESVSLLANKNYTNLAIGCSVAGVLTHKFYALKNIDTYNKAKNEYYRLSNERSRLLVIEHNLRNAKLRIEAENALRNAKLRIQQENADLFQDLEAGMQAHED